MGIESKLAFPVHNENEPKTNFAKNIYGFLEYGLL